MRPQTSCSITATEVYSWALTWLMQAKLVSDRGPKCTAATLLSVVLRAASRCISVAAACRDLAQAPSDTATMNGLAAGLPKSLMELELRLNEALTCQLPRRLRRRAWAIAIDWHLSPYYGQPFQDRNELYYGKPRQGTKQFHAYASACIVYHGQRYTLGLTYVQRHESTTEVLIRLLDRIALLGLKIRRVLLDRAFFNVPVVELLQTRHIPFLMPVMFRGRPPKKRKPATGLHWIKRQPAGWYRHTMKNKKREVTVSICVGYRRHKNRKDGKQVKQKLLFGAWRVKGTPTEIRNLYRLRFGIETSYRQMRQARIYTCTRQPRLRLLFVAVALILRNLWVWIHGTKLAEGRGLHQTLHLELLRFKQMLDWIVCEIFTRYHDGTTPSVKWNN